MKVRTRIVVAISLAALVAGIFSPLVGAPATPTSGAGGPHRYYAKLGSSVVPLVSMSGCEMTATYEDAQDGADVDRSFFLTRRTVGACTLTFNVDTAGNTQLHAWAVGFMSRTLQSESDLVRDVEIQVFNAAGSPIRRLVLVDAYPVALDIPTLDASKQGLLTMALTLAPSSITVGPLTGRMPSGESAKVSARNFAVTIDGITTADVLTVEGLSVRAVREPSGGSMEAMGAGSLRYARVVVTFTVKDNAFDSWSAWMGSVETSAAPQPRDADISLRDARGNEVLRLRLQDVLPADLTYLTGAGTLARFRASVLVPSIEVG